MDAASRRWAEATTGKELDDGQISTTMWLDLEKPEDLVLSIRHMLTRAQLGYQNAKLESEPLGIRQTLPLMEGKALLPESRTALVSGSDRIIDTRHRALQLCHTRIEAPEHVRIIFLCIPGNLRRKGVVSRVSMVTFQLAVLLQTAHIIVGIGNSYRRKRIRHGLLVQFRHESRGWTYSCDGT